METQLIRILPACLGEPLPPGWMDLGPEYLVELMPEVDHPEAVPISIQTTEPDILLVDADRPDTDPFVIAQSALAVREGLAVVFISSDSSPDRLRRAMLAGAEEYLLKPLDVASVRESILAIASHRTLRTIAAAPIEDDSNKVNGIVVGVVSGKGGLGKTTLATNMAAIVAKSGAKSAQLIGLESGDGSILLNITPKLGLLDMAAGASEDEGSYTPEVLRQFGTEHRSSLTYWTWHGTNTAATGEMPEDFLQRTFELCRNMADVTLVDFPLLTGDEAAAVLPYLDIIILVSSSSDLLALRSTKTFLNLMPPELAQRVRIIINRSDPSDMISREDFEQTIEHKVAAVLPNEPNTTAQAINMGTPFVLSQPGSDVSVTLRTLAQSLFKLPTTQTETTRRKGFLKLFG
jgi:pilus assembly protein CpaE